MIQFFGHAAVVSQLERALPRVALFRGLDSVGKRTLADYLAQYHAVQPADVFRAEQLTSEAARAAIKFCSTAPFGHSKVVVLGLDGASASSLNSLLKLLEEPPSTVVFFLLAEHAVLDTIVSRSTLFQFGPLTEDELFQVLTVRLGMQPELARTAAVAGRGQVSFALRYGEQDVSRALVLSVLKSLADGDSELLLTVASQWNADAHELLGRWVLEAVTGRWQLFSEQEAFGLTKDKRVPRSLLRALASSAPRPSLVLQAAVLPLVEARQQ